MKPIYKVEMKPTMTNKWLVTLYEVSDRGKIIVRSATCPLEKQAKKMYRLWKGQFVDKKEEKPDDRGN